MQTKENGVEKVENTSARSNTWASRSGCSIWEWQPRGKGSGWRRGRATRTNKCVFSADWPHNYPLSARSEAPVPAAATPSNISAAGETTKVGSTRSARRKLSANQRRGQSASRPISEREGGGQIWSGFFLGGRRTKITITQLLKTNTDIIMITTTIIMIFITTFF